MNYKLGDKVRIKSLDWYNQNKDEDGFVHCGDRIFDDYMSVFCESVVTIRGVYHKGFDIQEDMQCRTWTEDMIECLVERNGKTYPYKIGERVILKGNNRCATIVDLKYNSWGNLSYYIKIDNDKDISVDYPTNLLLPYDNVVEDVADVEPQDKMVSLNKVKEWLKNNMKVKTTSYSDAWDNSEIDQVVSDFYTIEEMINSFCKAMEE